MPLIALLLVLLAAPAMGESRKRWETFTGNEPWQRLFKYAQEERSRVPRSPKSVVAFQCADKETPARRRFAGLPDVDAAILSKPAQPISRLLGVLAATHTGRETMDLFLPLYRSGGIAMKQITKRKKREASLLTANAFYDYDGKARVIFVDGKSEAGLLAGVLFHEITHSVDPETVTTFDGEQVLKRGFGNRYTSFIEAAVKRSGKKVETLDRVDFPPEDVEELTRRIETMEQALDVASFRIERRAYDAQYAMEKELTTRYPAYFQHIHKDGKVLELHPVAVTDEQIVTSSGLNPAYIEKYKAGSCEPLR